MVIIVIRAVVEKVTDPSYTNISLIWAVLEKVADPPYIITFSKRVVAQSMGFLYDHNVPAGATLVKVVNGTPPGLQSAASQI